MMLNIIQSTFQLLRRKSIYFEISKFLDNFFEKSFENFVILLKINEIFLKVGADTNGPYGSYSGQKTDRPTIRIGDTDGRTAIGAKKVSG